MCILYVQNLDERDLWQNPYFFVTTEPNQTGFRRDVDN